jgi:hypothetical protein
MERPGESTDEYRPQDKDAPIPANEVPSDSAPDSSLPEIAEAPRKPRHKKAPIASVVSGVKNTVDTARKAVESVRDAVSPSGPKLSDKALAQAIDAKDKQRSAAVKRYRRETRGIINPLIRAVFIQEGIQGVSAESVDAVWTALQSITTPAGYRITKRGDVRVRRIPITDVFSYTFGSTALDVELWGARQWIAHPTVFDVLVIAGAGLSTYQAATLDGSPIREAIAEIVKSHIAKNEDPIKAEVRVSDPA